MILNKFEIFTEIQVTVQTNTGFEFLFLNFFGTIGIITVKYTHYTHAWPEFKERGFHTFYLKFHLKKFSNSNFHTDNK